METFKKIYQILMSQFHSCNLEYTIMLPVQIKQFLWIRCSYEVLGMILLQV
jgi:hypothetical protein